MNLALIGGMIAAAGAAWLFGKARPTALLMASLIFSALLQLDSGGSLIFPSLTVSMIISVWWLITPNADADTESLTARKRLALLVILGMIAVFALLKSTSLQGAVAAAAQARAPIDWTWIGFSYTAFRLLHVLLDYRTGRFAPVSLTNFALYVLFFPSIAAGPIARVEQFSKELADGSVRLDAARVQAALLRIARGLLKKFVIADSLALMALSAQLATDAQTGSIGAAAALWIALYAYALRLFFDFSGYTDIAIGIGILGGIKLPENFDAPYLKTNIKAFWDSWHMTLATWFRLYFFTPFSRFLIERGLKHPRELTVLLAQVGTMVLIGLWHGITLNFVLWGVWHGLGLWLFRQYQARASKWDEFTGARPPLARLMRLLGLVTTFHFVAIGWVFFALTDPSLIGKVLVGLVGAHGG